MDNIIEDLMNYFEEANTNKYNYHLMKSDIKRILEPYIEELKRDAYANGYRDAQEDEYDEGYSNEYDEGYEVAREELAERNEI